MMEESQRIRKRTQKRLWSKEEDEILRKSVEQYGTRWLQITQFLETRNASQCSQRWKRIRPTSQKKLPWTAEDDQKILELYQEYGRQWKFFAQNMPGRSSRAIRQRYMNQLNPKIVHTEFSEQEDIYIYERYIQLGPKWSIIAKGLKGRSCNQVKNRFYNKLRQDFLKINNPYFTKGQTNETQQEKCSDIEVSFDSDDHMYSHMAFYSRKYDEYE